MDFSIYQNRIRISLRLLPWGANIDCG